MGSGAGAQPSLFDDGEPAIDTSFAAAARTQLDEHSWVEHVPGWLSGPGAVLDALLAGAAWEQRRRFIVDHWTKEPRLTAEYRDPDRAPHPIVAAAASALSTHYGVTYDRLWLNLYRDHRDSTGWHGDKASCRRATCVVPVLSLGATRRFLLRSVAGGPSVVLRPSAGDLVVMGGRCQLDWRHCVPKQAAADGPRVSVNFASTAQGTAED